MSITALFYPGSLEELSALLLYLWACLAWVPFRDLAVKIKDEGTREDILGSFGAMVFLLLAFVWLTLLVTAYASIFWGLRDQLQPVLHDFSQAFYFAGTSVLTIGFGDVVPLTMPTRAVALNFGRHVRPFSLWPLFFILV